MPERTPAKLPDDDDDDDEGAALRARYKAAAQDHVFAFCDRGDLSPDEAASLARQLSSIDPDYVNSLYRSAMPATPSATAAAHSAAYAPVPDDVCLRLLPSCALDDKNNGMPALSSMRDKGLAAIRDGKVALLLLAGGQGTRLGSTAPKGCYDIGLPSKKSLFQLQAERLRRVVELANTPPENFPMWLIMVSPATHKETLRFFEKACFFGYPRANVLFFEQGELPALDAASGKFLMERKSRVAAAPDGNGGVYRALRVSGLLARLRASHVTHIHAYCVDNCLVKVLDPLFLGYAISKGAECATKTVAKASPEEPVGVVVSLNNSAYAVAEYSELPHELAAAKSSDGKRLLYGCANIANHIYTLEFLERVNVKLGHHVARKRVPCIDLNDGSAVTANAIKLEQFIFDVFPLCPKEKFAVLEARREDEFSPLKNKAGDDSPATSRRDIMAQSLRYLEAAGAIVDKSMHDAIRSGTDINAVCEISPLVSYAGENLTAGFKGKKLAFPIIINNEIKGLLKD